MPPRPTISRKRLPPERHTPLPADLIVIHPSFRAGFLSLVMLALGRADLPIRVTVAGNYGLRPARICDPCHPLAGLIGGAILGHGSGGVVLSRAAYASKTNCSTCALKEQCVPNKDARIVSRHVHEPARDKAREIAKTNAYADASRRCKKVEMLFPHLKKIMRLDRLRLRGANGANDEFILAATAENLRKLAKPRPMGPATT